MTVSALRRKRAASLVRKLPSNGILSIGVTSGPGHVELAEADRGEEPRQPVGNRCEGRDGAELEERRGHHHAREAGPARHARREARSAPPVEWARAKWGGGQSGSATCSMKASRSRSYSVKLSIWPLRRLRSRRSEPPWPRQSKVATAIAAAAQIADHLEIFLDALRPALEQADRAARAARCRAPAGKAQLHAVAGGDHAGDGAFRHRVRFAAEEFHARPR